MAQLDDDERDRCADSGDGQDEHPSRPPPLFRPDGERVDQDAHCRGRQREAGKVE